ncbi:FCD domain-containing protein [Nocardioides rotundus]|uniref:FadR/GntR family transcriptional regulator n=1 Tax=Nocardioides rotundus TaxID=1774216 RepID=UPI001CC19213|nr:FCD domain-containing protein [Nocardioides rotundus]UAL31068.1 FCD domain-containing protein [Nocardioides rotundus]
MATTLHHDVLADLGPRVVSGELREGESITLEWVGAEYDVSRTVAREVIQVLVSMHLVDSRRRTGITARPHQEWDVYNSDVIRWRLAGPGRVAHLHELSQLRAAIEPAAAEMAAARASAEVRTEVLRLSEALERTGAAGDLRRFLEHDVRFHQLLLLASGNPMFSALTDVVEAVLRARTELDLMPPEPKSEARAHHVAVARAVAGSDGPGARRAMTAICLEVAGELDELVD